MAEEDIFKAIPSEEFTKDPVAFGFLMDFQYGAEEEFEEGLQQIFGESIDGVLVRSLEELELVLPDLDFWVEQNRKGRRRENYDYRLYANQEFDSRLGAKYLEQAGLEFELRPVQRKTVSVGTDRVPLPVLVNREGISFKALRGVKGFIRRKLLQESGIKQLKYDIHSNWHNDKEVTCFSKTGQETYRGPINNAPHPILSKLNEYYFKDWSKVASWELGNFKELSQTREKNKPLILPKSKTVLFPDDWIQLSSGKDIITNKSSSEYHVIYEVCFKKDEKVFKLYASIID